MDKGATFSNDEKYRYLLWRQWDTKKPIITFVGLNPSTANGLTDDNTITRLINFTYTWSFGGFKIVNLFALKATDPGELIIHPDPIGPDNDDYLLEIAKDKTQVVFMWGNGGRLHGRNAIVMRMFKNPLCFGITKCGQPIHPLYLPKETKLIKYK
jgi:hypothetical protein